MPKNIKQRERQSHTIRKLDREVAFTSRIKRRMIDQYQKARQQKNNKEDKENSNASNYAVSKVIRVGKRGSKETTYAITGISKDTYRNAKLKLLDRQMRKKQDKENTEINNENFIKTREVASKEDKFEKEEISKHNYNQRSINSYKNNRSRASIENKSDTTIETKENIVSDNKAQAIKEYQKSKLIKEKQQYKNIREHSYRDNGIKENTNTIKIKTRENAKLLSHQSANMEIKKPSQSSLMKKSSIQKTKEKATTLKEKGKKAGKAVVNGGKKVAKGVKGIGLFLGAGGGFVLLLVIVIIMIAGFFKSMFGIFFTNDTATSVGNISVGSALTRLEEQVDDEIEDIKNSVSYDKVVVDKETIWWKDIVAIYAVIASNRDGIDVANMDDRAFNKLKEIFDEVVDVDYETSTYYVTHVYTVNGEQVRERESRTRLEINVTCKTFDDMVGMYSFSDAERNQALLLLSQEYDEMWEKIFEEF